jgi:hypothetical protein
MRNRGRKGSLENLLVKLNDNENLENKYLKDGNLEKLYLIRQRISAIKREIDLHKRNEKLEFEDDFFDKAFSIAKRCLEEVPADQKLVDDYTESLAYLSREIHIQKSIDIEAKFAMLRSIGNGLFKEIVAHGKMHRKLGSQDPNVEYQRQQLEDKLIQIEKSLKYDSLVAAASRLQAHVRLSHAVTRTSQIRDTSGGMIKNVNHRRFSR